MFGAPAAALPDSIDERREARHDLLLEVHDAELDFREALLQEIAKSGRIVVRHENDTAASSYSGFRVLHKPPAIAT
jgi:hypothetical protein